MLQAKKVAKPRTDKQLQQLHTLTAKATIAHKMYSAGLITKEDFKKQ